MSLLAKETTSLEDIKTVLCHPEIYDCITDDNSPDVSEFEPPINDDYLYIGGYAKGEIIALMVYHRYLDGNECHVQVLPEHRKEYAKDFGEQSLVFRGTRPLYAKIPEMYKNVLEFAICFGFEIIDKHKNSFIKNGISYDDNILRFK